MQNFGGQILVKLRLTEVLQSMWKTKWGQAVTMGGGWNWLRIVSNFNIDPVGYAFRKFAN